MWRPEQCPWSRLLTALVAAAMLAEVVTLNGPNVCMVKQKYNITKRIKYRAPMSIRTYQWCLNIPPRCSHWTTEMRDLTRLETEERVAEVSVCCPGYKMKDVSCVPICPNGKTGPDCTDDCGPNRWGPNCAHECKACSENGHCSPVTGECLCQGGWQGERCEIIITTSTSTTAKEELLTTFKAITKTTSTSTAMPLTTRNEGTTPLTIAPTTDKSTTTVLSVPTPKTEPPTAPKTQLESTPTAEITKFKFPLSSKPNITSNLSENDTVKTTSKTELKDLNDTYITIETSTSTYSTIPTATEIPLKTSITQHELNGSTITIPSKSEVLSSTKLNSSVTTTPKVESTRRPEPNTKIHSTTAKFKPKEIWIKPAQKEPEHITAVMSENESSTSSLNLSSVLSIVGGVMMAIITVAVIIVMMERCRRPRYDAVNKINDMRMQVIIDGNDVPPPYVRSIFHTPLPEPPDSEKCHYQPISTLDRNLKQFMRPVVVQTISPVMLENFRSILECHYDHLPRRNHDFSTLPANRTAPPMNDVNQQLLQRASLTESAIEALKCEAKLDVIDITTSEPLYAEIPCWRPPSEHAVEIMNVNGEAVTEL